MQYIQILIDTIFPALTFFSTCWITNISFNLLNPLKKRFEFIKKLNGPIDRNIIFIDGKRLLGNSQGHLSFFVVVMLPILLWIFFEGDFFIDLIKSTCVFIGDMLGSFIKRRLSLKQGQFLPFIDHGDYIIFTSIVFYIFFDTRIFVLVSGLILTYIFHPVVCLIGYKLKIKDEPL